MSAPKRFIPINKLKRLLKQRESIDNKIYSYNLGHCRECGDTKPKHGFYPLYGMAVGPGIYQTSSLICNRCRLTDQEYLDRFGEHKENIHITKKPE